MYAKLADGPTLLQLRVFTTVAETGSITRTCEVLSYLNPSSVSYHIHQLERFYAVNLFERSNRGMTPTPAGKLLYRAAREIVDTIEHTGTEIQALRGSFHGPFNIGTPMATFFLVTHAFRAFSASFPDMNVGLFIYPDSTEALRGLYLNQAHVTLVCHHPLDDALETHHFAREPMLLVASAQHPLARCDDVSLPLLARECLLTYPDRSEARSLVDKLLHHCGLCFDNVQEIARTSQIKEAALEGQGLAVLPESAMYIELRYGLLKRINCSAVGGLHRDGYVSFLRRAPARPMIEGLLEVAKNITRESIRYDHCTDSTGARRSDRTSDPKQPERSHSSARA